MDHHHHIHNLYNGLTDPTRWIQGGSCLPMYEQTECSKTSRWARQETLTLLEIRYHLHRAFKDSNLKAPLWDQVSRIMRDEHGYDRSGKKCKEKFENLYKYYKKTKECNTGRQDGKNYRFFRQLEAICGGSNKCKPNPIELKASLSEKYDRDLGEIEKVIESRMGVLIERQDFWMEKIMYGMEYKELIRISKEDEWRKHEAIRFDEEYKILARERAFKKARDTDLILTLKAFAEIETTSDEIS